MFNNKRFFVLLLLLAFTLSFIAYFVSNINLQQIHINMTLSEQEQIDPAKHGFLLYTTFCKIPDLNPLDPAVLQQIKRLGEMFCTSMKSITYVEGSTLRLNRTKIKQEFKNDFKYCQYQPISRPKNHDYSYAYGNESKPFDNDILVPPENEFMRINCYSNNSTKITTDFHALVAPKENVEQRCDYSFNQHVINNSPKETYNVQMVGMDSVSRLNFIRQMPQTRKFLQDELKAFEMCGYNKVGDNTFFNAVPILTGKFVEELPWNETMSKLPFDNYSMIWKIFSQAGYRTMYSEDAPYGAIFNYVKEGFHVAPTDYYNRALAVAMEKQESIWSNGHHCISDRMETSMLLDYVTDFARVFKDKPRFSFTFITRLTHDSMDLVSSADYPYVKFLKRFKEEGLFNNTVLIFFSDHGFRFGSFRASYIGKIEERLPFMYFVFPPSFHEKYPQLVKNLRTNSRRLTTPFDIYETLKDLLYFDGLDRKANVTNRGISLLREIPEERSCKDAGILPHWCVCLESKKLDIASKETNNIANSVVNLLNSELASVTHICDVLTLHNISEIAQMETNEKVLKFSHAVNEGTVIYNKKVQAPLIYQVTLTTVPGYGLFEVTVVHDTVKNSFKLGADISRINMYGNQSICVDNSKLRKVCFCK